MRLRWAASMITAALVVVLGSCSSYGTGGTNGTFNPTPILGCGQTLNPNCALFPTDITAGSQNFTLFVSGSGFISKANGNLGNSTATWNGSSRPTTLNINSGQLAVTIFASDVATAGEAQIGVVNPTPGGGPSNSNVTFTINGPKTGDPVITSLSPASVSSGGAAFSLTVNGSNFLSNYVVTWNGSWRTPATVTSTQITVAISASDIATPGCASVAVLNPVPAGASSSAMDVAVTAGGSGGSTSCTGPAPAARSFPQVISINARGGAANGPSFAPAISSDGRYVAFYSSAKNLVVASAAGNIFLRDTCRGAANCTPLTRPVDLASNGSAPNGAAGDQLALSADGRFVAFSTYATNLVPGAASGPPADSSRAFANIYLRDLCTGPNAPAGCTPHTELISQGADMQPADNSSIAPQLSADGRFVTFTSWASNLVAGLSGSEARVFVRDTCAGPTATKSCVEQTYLVPGSAVTAVTGAEYDHPAISANGRYVAFQAWTPAPGSSSQSDSRILLRDTCLGPTAPPSCIPSTAEVSIGADQSSLGGVNELPSLSEDGRFVVFESQSAGASGAPVILLRDTCLGATAPDGCVPSTSLISTARNSIAGGGYTPWISASGRYITFVAPLPSTAGAATSASSARTGILSIRDTCIGATSSCTAATYTLASPAPDASSTRLLVDLFTPVPLT
ncbi:MAG: hypothetical protein ACRD4M_02940, partial [Candidatus Acidiferrales bacterium]